MQKILVVGGGFVGQSLVQLLREQGESVVVLDQEPHRGTVCGSVGEKATVNSLALANPSITLIFFCASTSKGGVEQYEYVFVQGLKNLIEAFPQAKIVFCSSTSVYAESKGRKVTETSLVNRVARTTTLLLEAENLVVTHGGVVARIAALYGPGRSMVLTRYLKGEPVLDQQGYRWVNQVHRDDVVQALVLLGKSDEACGEIYNVCDDLPIQQKKMYVALMALLSGPPAQVKPKDKYVGKRPWSDKQVVNSKLKKLGWTLHYQSFLEAVPDILPTLPDYVFYVDDWALPRLQDENIWEEEDSLDQDTSYLGKNEEEHDDD